MNVPDIIISNDFKAFLELNSDAIRKLPVTDENILNLKLAEVTYRVSKIVYNSAKKKFKKELALNHSASKSASKPAFRPALKPA